MTVIQTVIIIEQNVVEVWKMLHKYTKLEDAQHNKIGTDVMKVK